MYWYVLVHCHLYAIDVQTLPSVTSRDVFKLVLTFFFFKYLFIYLFWLHQVLVAACRIFLVAARGLLSCGMRDLVPRQGIEPGPPAFGAQSLLPTGPAGKSWFWLFFDPVLLIFDHSLLSGQMFQVHLVHSLPTHASAISSRSPIVVYWETAFQDNQLRTRSVYYHWVGHFFWGFFFSFLAMPCSLWDLSSPTRATAVKAWNPNH